MSLGNGVHIDAAQKCKLPRCNGKKTQGSSWFCQKHDVFWRQSMEAKRADLAVTEPHHNVALMDFINRIDAEERVAAEMEGAKRGQ